MCHRLYLPVPGENLVLRFGSLLEDLDLVNQTGPVRIVLTRFALADIQPAGLVERKRRKRDLILDFGAIDIEMSVLTVPFEAHFMPLAVSDHYIRVHGRIRKNHS